MAEIHEKISELSNILLGWVDCNGLALNLKKTTYMVFSRQKINQNFNLVINNTQIERKSEARFLGIIVDDKLTWKQHIIALKSKMSRYVGIMYKIRNLLPAKALLQIFHSFVQSHLNFCSIVWGFSAKSNIEALFASQKKGLRAVMRGHVNYYYKDGNPPTHTKPAFQQYKVLTVQGIIAKNALIFMHKVNQLPRELPNSIRETIPQNAPCANPDYVNCQEWLAEYGTTIHNKSIFYKGPLLYSDYIIKRPLSPSSCISINAYKINVKRDLLDVQAQGDVDEWQNNNFLLYNICGLRKSKRIKLVNISNPKNKLT